MTTFAVWRLKNYLTYANEINLELMIATQLKIVALCMILLCAFYSLTAQQCSTDSNYYTIFYNAPNNNLINAGIKTAQNELVILGQSSDRSSFVTKFTSQGNVIWSKKYEPDYPFVSYVQYPWYNDSRLNGIANSSDSTFFVYGSITEHGR